MDNEMRSNFRSEPASLDHENTTNSQRDVTNKIFSHRFVFQRLLLTSTIQLGVYLNKVYHDCEAVHTYYNENQTHFLVLSVTALILPPILYTLFLIGENLIKDDSLDILVITKGIINGLFLIPWQIKKHVDVLHYASQRVCVFSKPEPREQEKISEINRRADILEFFEDFYAGVLHLILQSYILWHINNDTHGVKEFSVSHLLKHREIIASALSVLSLMIAVRRRDDGLLTKSLSFIGWISLFVSRIAVFVLVASYIGAVYMAALCLLHCIAMSAWIFSIAIKSYEENADTDQSHRWTTRKKTSLALLVFFLFGLPSLLMWPIMFQLRQNKRLVIFLLIITVENLALIAIWYLPIHFNPEVSLEEQNDANHIASAVVYATLLALLFLSMYNCCKPAKTDQVVQYEMHECSAQSYGVYFEFCNLVFKLPSTDSIGAQLQYVRRLDAALSGRT